MPNTTDVSWHISTRYGLVFLGYTVAHLTNVFYYVLDVIYSLYVCIVLIFLDRFYSLPTVLLALYFLPFFDKNSVQRFPNDLFNLSWMGVERAQLKLRKRREGSRQKMWHEKIRYWLTEWYFDEHILSPPLFIGNS